MKRFICNILLFVLPFMFFLSVLDYYYSRAAMKSNFFRIDAWYDLMHGQIDADVIVMGSSRAWVHIDPLILDSILNTSAYNIGMDGSCINRQIHKYNLFRKYNRKPKLIIQNIDQFSLDYNVGFEREQFFPYFWDKGMRDEFLDSEPISVWEKYVPMYRYFSNMNDELYAMLTNTSRQLTKGYLGRDWHWDGTALSKVKSIKFSTNDTTLVMFDEYLAKLKAENIKIVFVYSPLYVGAMRKFANVKEMYSTYQRIADKYGIPILDYMNMEISSDTTYFYNAMHLNKRGAEIFSDSLANGIKRLGILR